VFFCSRCSALFGKVQLVRPKTSEAKPGAGRARPGRGGSRRGGEGGRAGAGSGWAVGERKRLQFGEEEEGGLWSRSQAFLRDMDEMERDEEEQESQS
jgi:hypothetical protein